MPLVPSLLAPSKLAEKSARPTRVTVRDKSYSNELISIETAFMVSAVISIIRLKAQDLASIPLLFYARRGRAKFRALESPYYRLMHDQPNPEMSSVIFRELVVTHIDAWGDFFAQIIVDEAGIVRELWPLRPDRMTVKRVEGMKIYEYQQSEGGQRIFLQDEILHIPGFGFDGLRGMSRIAQARHAIGLSISTEKFGSKFFSNGANFDLVFRHPNELSDDAANALTESIRAKYSGSDNSHKFIVLEEDMSVEKIGIPPDDAQFLETRRFQLDEINRIVGPVPPHLIGDLEKSTSWGTGIDAQEQGYINHSLFPYARRIEQALDTQLLLPAEREQGLFYEHLFDGFLRGDIQTRYEAYMKAITNGFMTRNEAREKENMNPRKGLDDLLQPLNMASVGGSGLSENNRVSESPVAAFQPLWRDAITRVIKREANDVQGASKRLQAKGQEDAYGAWLDQFYREDHPAFMQKQFDPLVEAQKRLFDMDIRTQLDVFTQEFLDQRHMQVKTMSAEQLADGIETYAARAAQEMLAFVMSVSSPPREDFDEEYFDEQ